MTLRCDHCDGELPEDLVDVLVITLVCGERIVLGRRCCVRGIDGYRQSTIPERAELAAEVASVFGPRPQQAELTPPRTAAEVDATLDRVLDAVIGKPQG